MSAVAPATRRLLAVLRLAEKPGTAGERAGAESALGRMVVHEADTFRSLLATARAPHREPLHGTWRTVCAELATRPGALSPWERSFVASLPNLPRISTKQRYTLLAIAGRVLGRGQ